MFSMHQIGINYAHSSDFSIDRPEGSGDYLLIVFKTPAVLLLGEEEIPVPADSAVIFKKGGKQYYRALIDTYCNHYLHFDTDTPETEMEGIRTGCLLFPRDMPEAEQLLRMINKESLSHGENSAVYVSLLIRLLLLKISETTEAHENSVVGLHENELLELRAEFHNNPALYSDIPQMARHLGLSVSHFQQLYKEQFGVSCYSDLLAARMKRARYYLSETTLSVGEIAALCGYENVTCFLHRFKAKCGVTPGEYRKRAQEKS
ncbi:MAG: AraC family transcriptional regulator [Lachnospiraceae bacterium]|nr:AraC family transcriptional regulator [Lachnospiraceae bacterium]